VVAKLQGLSRSFRLQHTVTVLTHMFVVLMCSGVQPGGGGGPLAGECVCVCEERVCACACISMCVLDCLAQHSSCTSKHISLNRMRNGNLQEINVLIPMLFIGLVVASLQWLADCVCHEGDTLILWRVDLTINTACY
jgi:hypothetical protein